TCQECRDKNEAADMIERLRDELNEFRTSDAKQIHHLKLLCKASWNLLMGSDAIYDPRGDVGPTHWKKTRDELLDRLAAAIQLEPEETP
ncbi:MAG: hypothetical protein MJA29_03585, partial [Candidatus Omnitrophica bacterium]|nr:hypothetical protein [Candidatus Omnitrophota bacterium]